MKFDKLKGKLREKKVNYKIAAEKLGISATSFSSKINGRSRFYYDEIRKLGNLLELTNEEVIDIFLKKN